MNEIETRIVDIDVDDIRKKMMAANALKVKAENQTNHIFDFEDRRLLSQKGYARVRVVEDTLTNKFIYFMTTKKIISQEKYKVMEENEVTVDNAETAINLFKSLGLIETETIKKYRESYKYKNTLVEIDINDPSFCPFPYIEIETSSEDELKEVVDLLGYKMADTTSATIYEIMKNRTAIDNWYLTMDNEGWN